MNSICLFQNTIQVYIPKKNRIHYSGPLVPLGGSIEDMLKEHERQIQQLFIMLVSTGRGQVKLMDITRN